MQIGVPKEIKAQEYRVGLTPAGVGELVKAGHTLLVEQGAGAEAGFSDVEYEHAGAQILEDATEVFARSTLIVKVKEPQAEELQRLQPHHLLFTYLHLAPDPDQARGLLNSGAAAIAYETVQIGHRLPLLEPMSEVAGRMSVQIGAHFLERHNGGRGVLLGGTPGVQPGRVVVLGAGNVGWNAAWMAAGLQAEVNVLDKNIERLRFVDQIQMGRVTTLASNRGNVERVVAEADLVIGAVLVPGGRAPVVVTEAMVRSMQPGAVIVDIAVDQGGCVETTRETTHEAPVYVLHDVVHYAVGNMPGAVPNTSTYALTNVTLPYLSELSSRGVAAAVREDPALALGVNTMGGHVVNAAVAEALDRPVRGLDDAHPGG